MTPMKIACFGDSHGHYFRDVYPHLATVETNTIDGATIVGLGRRDSTLNAKNTIFNSISALTDDDFVALKFGQVDVELGYYYRTVVKGEVISFDEFLTLLIESYLTFIQEIKKLHEHIVICGINLPTIFNHQHAVEYTAKIITENIEEAALREVYMQKLSESLPSIQGRTQLSIEFNAALKKACLAHNILYFDLTQESLNPGWGLVSSKFRPFIIDHHYPLTYEIVEIFTQKLIMTVKGL